MESEEGTTKKKLHRLNRSSNIISVIKSRTIKWTSHIATIEEGRRAFKILTE